MTNQKVFVKEVSKIGAFLFFFLERDLLLPFREQTHPVRKGERRERHASGFRKFNTSFIHIRAGREVGELEIPGTL